MVEGAIEQKIVILSKLGRGLKAPFGLSAADTAASVRNRVPDGVDVFVGKYASDATQGFLATDSCLLNKKGEVFWVEFHFDAGGYLVSYSTRLPSVRD